MSNPFYDPGTQRAPKVRELFRRIATRYDLLNDVQSLGGHRYWKKRVIVLARVCSGDRALDVCCGTGDLAFRLANAGADAVGLDFSPEMLAVALQRQRSRPRNALGTIQFLPGDAQLLPFADSSFDVATVGYGLRNLEDWRRGLAEIARVLRPGGRVLVLDFGKPPRPIWRAIYFGYLRLIVPVLGFVFCGSAKAYGYILESLKHYPAQEGIAAEMSHLGLENVRIHSFLGGVMTINSGEKPS